MELLQLIALVLFLWTVITVLTMGLFSAPWYVLLSLLVLTWIATRSLMPNQNAIAKPPVEFQSPTISTDHQLIEPGSAANVSDPITQTKLIYRGTSYTHTAQAAEHQETGASSELQPTSIESSKALIYRGTRVVRPSEPSSSPS